MWSSSAAERAVFSWLVAPHSIDDFAGHYERAPFHISRNESGRYDRYFSLQEMERVLFGCELNVKDLQIIKDGTAARPETYTRSHSEPKHPLDQAAGEIVNPDRASALFASGCTVVLDNVNKYSASMASLCRDLEMFFGCHVNPNVYMTPPGNQGFAVHYDTHDALIVQIRGSKHWRVYESAFRLPLEHQYWDKKLYPAGNMVLDMEMRPGDFLYIPRGCLHEAKANDELSLHVTIGLYPTLWTHVAAQALMRAAEALPSLRQAADEDAAEAISAELAQVLAPARLTEALRAARRSWRNDRDNGLEGQLEQLAALPHLNEASIVRRRPNLSYEWMETERGVTLTFSGKTVILSKSAAVVIRKLEAASELDVAALCEQDESALKAVRKLIQEGFAIQELGGERRYRIA